MSHFTKIKTKIQDLNRLKQVLKQLNYQYSEASADGKLTISGWQNKEQQVALEIKTGCKYGVGVVVSETGEFELVADWWGVETYTGVSREGFLNKIMSKYAYNSVLDKIKAKGYTVVEEAVDDKQQVRLLVRKWE